MREESQSLKNVGGSPTLRGDVDSFRGVEQHIGAGEDSSFVGRRKPRNAVQKRGLACSGRSEQDGNAGRNFDGNVEKEGGGAHTVPLFTNSCRKHGRIYFAGHGVHTRRLTA